MRKIKVITPSGRVVIETSATTFGELRAESSFPHVDLTKNEVTIKGSDVSLRLDTAALPEGDLVMYVTATEQKAGMSKEAYYQSLTEGQIIDLCNERGLFWSSDKEENIELLLEDDAEFNESISQDNLKENLKERLSKVVTELQDIIESFDDEDYEFDLQEVKRLSEAVKNIK